jgi:3-carboxy-cis,cis-muconate cycloisomerase
MNLYSEIFYSREAAVLLSEQNTLAQMLRATAALAKAQAGEGLVPQKHANTIAQCCKTRFLDLEKLKTGIKSGGNATIPLVRQLTQTVLEKDPEAAKYVYLGATSQDIVDTATVLRIRSFIDWMEGKLDVLEKILLELTRKHRNTLMIGRTLLQHAIPITFGLKTAGWLESISRSKSRISETKKRVLVVQLAGAAGSGNRYISNAVQRRFAKILGLKPAPSWHTHRDNLAEMAAVSGILTGSLGKIAKDVSLLMQTEVGEAFEGAAAGKGGSSAMPHKRNPVTCAAILANAHRVPFLVASLLAVLPQEHERSAGLWHAEWEVFDDLLLLSAGALERSVELLEGLEVDEARMLQNLEQTKGLIYAEQVSMALAEKMGKAAAHEWVEKACKTALSEQKHLKTVLLEASEAMTSGWTPDGLDELFKPENAVGLSFEIVDDILKKY